MYERLPLDFIGITDPFGERKDPITYTSSYHYGVDLGWHKYQGEKVYAIYDSKVVYNEYDDNLGNYLVLTYDKDDKTIIYRFLHLKEKPSLNIGDKVKRGEVVGYMGTTGYSTGYHLHFEYWVCPLGYKYHYADRSKYAKNPLDYCYLFQNQEVSKDDVSSIIKVVGTEKIVKRDESKNQIEVVGESLRCRKYHNLKASVYGYVDYGIYNTLETYDEDGYTWYKIDNDMWVADVKDTLKVYNIKQDTDDSKTSEDKDKDKDKEETDVKNLKKFVATKDDYYYIYLKKGEVVYY